MKIPSACPSKACPSSSEKQIHSTVVNRRAFLKQAGSGLAGAVLTDTSVLWAAQETSAELILQNGILVTMNEAQPTAEAMAIRNGRLLAVGSNAQMTRYRSSATKVLDLAGKCVSPGLIDAHSHLIAFGQMQLKFVLLRPPKINSFASLNAELAKAGAKILAHVNTARRLSETQKVAFFNREIPPLPVEGRPKQTFRDKGKLSFGGHEVRYEYLPDDPIFGATRTGLAWQHTQNFAPGFNSCWQFAHLPPTCEVPHSLQNSAPVMLEWLQLLQTIISASPSLRPALHVCRT